ncbi:MAG: hypothetical protein Q4D64_08485 [Prevotellaceae bacterium]|nr:hypothetical protein [Prevotellaceae bacterium]
MLYKTKKVLISVLTLASCMAADAQTDSTKTFWDNWFVQFGADMTVQKPHGHAFKDALSKGTSFGVDVAVGKWFTREVALRGKLCWDNGIIDSRAEWLAPFNQPGVNHDKGGFLSFVGDAMLDLHNVFGEYREDRMWNAQVFLRAGAVYNFGCDKGSPLIGMGLANQFRLSDRWGLYADVAYNGVSSGFTMDPSTATGIGSGSNMYFTLDMGVTYRLGGSKRQKFSKDTPVNSFKSGGIWKNWFLQYGIDMTLYNPCEKSFSDVFPDGFTTGLDIAVGKWFSPEVGVRGKLNLENFLIENKNLKWLPYDEEKHTSNYDGGGCVMAYCDVLLSAKHILMGYVQDHKWDMYAFGRMGLGKNRSIDSLSPVVGAGIGGTYRLSRHFSLYFDTAYEGITSEFFSGVSWSGATGGRFNGIWDFNLGLQVNIGCK